jgi:GAF domain-containing protein
VAAQAATRAQDIGSWLSNAGDPPIYDLEDLGAQVLNRTPARRVPSPAAAAALEAEIDRAGSRDAVARLALYLARGYASASALLLVHRGIVQGLCADFLERADTILLPADESSVFGEVAASGKSFRGAPPTQGLDARILRAFGREHAQEIAILPITLRGRVVGLLYADNGPEALGDASAAALTSVCARVAAAWERLIHARKRSAAA